MQMQPHHVRHLAIASQLSSVVLRGIINAMPSLVSIDLPMPCLDHEEPSIDAAKLKSLRNLSLHLFPHDHSGQEPWPAHPYKAHYFTEWAGLIKHQLEHLCLIANDHEGEEAVVGFHVPIDFTESIIASDSLRKLVLQDVVLPVNHHHTATATPQNLKLRTLFEVVTCHARDFSLLTKTEQCWVSTRIALFGDQVSTFSLDYPSWRMSELTDDDKSLASFSEICSKAEDLALGVGEKYSNRQWYQHLFQVAGRCNWRRLFRLEIVVDRDFNNTAIDILSWCPNLCHLTIRPLYPRKELTWPDTDPSKAIVRISEQDLSRAARNLIGLHLPAPFPKLEQLVLQNGLYHLLLIELSMLLLAYRVSGTNPFHRRESPRLLIWQLLDERINENQRGCANRIADIRIQRERSLQASTKRLIVVKKPSSAPDTTVNQKKRRYC